MNDTGDNAAADQDHSWLFSDPEAWVGDAEVVVDEAPGDEVELSGDVEEPETSPDADLAGDDVEEKLETAAEEPATPEQNTEPASEPAPVDGPPAWLEPLMQAMQAGFVTAIERLVPAKAPEPPPAEDAPEPFAVRSVLLAGMEAKGISPESVEGKEIMEAAALDVARSYFSEESVPQIDARVEKANQRGRKLSADQKLRQELADIRARLDKRDQREARGPVLQRVANAVANDAEFGGQYPAAAKVSEDALREYLEFNIDGALTKQNLAGAMSELDDWLADLDLPTAQDARALANLLRTQGDRVRAAVLESYRGAEEPPPEAPAERPKTKKSPETPRAARGGRVEARDNEKEHLAFLLSDSAHEHEIYAERTEQFERNTRPPKKPNGKRRRRPPAVTRRTIAPE